MSEQGRLLTEQHRRRQLAVRSAAARQVSALWRSSFDVSDIGTSWLLIAEGAVPIVEQARMQSANHAAEYFTRFRAAAGPGPRRARPMHDVDGRTVSRACGYAARIVPLKMIKAGATPTQAARAGMQQTVGAVSKLVSDGSRETLVQAVNEDDRARGWQRVTGPNPCEFCAMLSARGGVYRTEASAGFEAHSGRGAACQCEPEPVYGDTRFLSPEQQAWRDLYNAAAKGAEDPLAEFRRAYRQQQNS